MMVGTTVLALDDAVYRSPESLLEDVVGTSVIHVTSTVTLTIKHRNSGETEFADEVTFDAADGPRDAIRFPIQFPTRRPE